jgi:hypothetical protein
VRLDKDTIDACAEDYPEMHHILDRYTARELQKYIEQVAPARAAPMHLCSHAHPFSTGVPEPC